jgi:hypothetical protein
MPLRIDPKLTPPKLLPALERMFELSAAKISSLEKSWQPADGTPVFTVKGRYTSRGWTEWTQGFQFGSAILQFDATGEAKFLESGRRNTIERMATHVSHTGVHDHGFNNISTYGNLLRLMHEGKIEWNDREKDFYELALKVSGAVQAARWTRIANGSGFIHSFNGPHSLFIDTVRSLRSLAVAHRLGHVLMSERDERVSLLKRLLDHAETSSDFSIYYGMKRDAFDVYGRTAHEIIFNTKDGSYRCPSSQQGYSAFSTWTRGLAWAICGFAELLEFSDSIPREEFKQLGFQGGMGEKPEPVRCVSYSGHKPSIVGDIWRAAMATAEFYVQNVCVDGIPMWDTGAPNLHRLGNYLGKVSNPFNAWEPVDSSAAAIAAQGLIRLGKYLLNVDRDRKWGTRYLQAGLTITRTLLDEPYLSTNPKHQGLLLHSVYHRPNGWDYIAPGQKVPNGESSMWGDYHLRELALMLLREARGETYLTFFGCVPGAPSSSR